MARTVRIALVALLLAACAGIVAPARAYMISYSLDGLAPTHFPGPVTPPADAPWGPGGYPGDTIEMLGSSGTWDMDVAPPTELLSTLLWTIDYTYAGTATDPDAWTDLAFLINEPRNLTIGSETHALVQLGHLDVTWENDFLSFDDGATVSYTTQGHRIDVTPLGFAPVGGVVGGNNPWPQPALALRARIDVAELSDVPEPGTLALLGLVVLGAGIGSWRRKR